MSHENAKVVRRALDALDRSDVDAYLALASPQIELINRAFPGERPLTGHEGVRRFFGELDIFATHSTFEIEDVMAVGESVLALFTLITAARTSRVVTMSRLAGVYVLDRGKVRRVQIFVDRAEARAAVGLSE